MIEGEEDQTILPHGVERPPHLTEAFICCFAEVYMDQDATKEIRGTDPLEGGMGILRMIRNEVEK